MDTGERLEIFIKTAYKNQTYFANLINIKPQMVNKIIRYGSDINRETLSRIYELGCDLTWLLTGSGSMFANNETGEYLRDQFGSKETTVNNKFVTREEFEELKKKFDETGINVKPLKVAAGRVEDYLE